MIFPCEVKVGEWCAGDTNMCLILSNLSLDFKRLVSGGRAIASYYSAHKIGLNGGGDGSGSASFGSACEGRRGFGFPPARE